MYIIGDFWWVWLILAMVFTVYLFVNLVFSLALGGCVDAISIANMKLHWYQSMFLGVWKLLATLALSAVFLILLTVSIIINIVL